MYDEQNKDKFGLMYDEHYVDAWLGVLCIPGKTMQLLSV